MKKILLRFWPILIILGLWFIFSSPYFLKSKVPYASTYQVTFFHPWLFYQQFAGPVKNNAMPDIHSEIYPWKKFTIDSYKNGQIPLWNPYSFSGNPHLANSQSAVLTPFNLLFLILPFIDAWSLLILFQPILAGIFMYLLGRSLGMSKSGALISAVSFMFCGFIVVWMAYGTMSFAILYLPLALWAIEKYFQQRRLKFLLVLALTVPLSFFSGHIQTSLYFLIGVLFYLFFKGIIINRNLHTACYLLLATLFGVVLSLPQLIPTYNLYLLSMRSEVFGGGGTISPFYLITMIAPDFFGNAVTRNDWFGYYAEWASFIGIWPFLLAILGIFKRRKEYLPFIILGVSSLILATCEPLASFFGLFKIPVLSNSAMGRIICLFSFSFAVLAGFGLDHLLLNLKEKEGLKKTIALLFIMTIFMMGIWFILFFVKPMPAQGLLIAKRNFILPTLLFLPGLGLILSSFKYKKLILFVSLYLISVTCFDSLRYAQKWMPFDPRNLVYPEVPIVEAIKKNIGDGRIFGNLGEEVGVYYGFPITRGYDPLYISRYGEFVTSLGGDFVKPGRSTAGINGLDKMTDRVLDLLGVSLIYHPIADTYQKWAYPVWEKKDRYEIVYQDDKFLLFKNKEALPRASLFYNYQVIPDGKSIIKTFYNQDFNFRRILILEKDPGINLKEGKGEAKITYYSANKVIIKAITNRPSLLFLSDNYYPTWDVEVNGRKAEILRADYTFRAVVVPEGESIIQFNMRWF